MLKTEIDSPVAMEISLLYSVGGGCLASRRLASLTFWAVLEDSADGC